MRFARILAKTRMSSFEGGILALIRAVGSGESSEEAPRLVIRPEDDATLVSRGNSINAEDSASKLIIDAIHSMADDGK